MGKNAKNTKTIKNRDIFSRLLSVILTIVAVLAVAFAGVIVFQKSYYERFYVNGQSMYPFLNEDACDKNGNKFGASGGNLSSDIAYNIDYGIMDTHKSALNKLKRFDIVVWDTSNDPTEPSYLIKRIVGLPGEIIKFNDDGDLFVKANTEFVKIDQPVDEKYIHSTYPDNEIQLQNDEFYLLGDNRDHSSDSRSKGVAKKSHIIGKAVAIIGKCELVKESSNYYKLGKVEYYKWPRWF